MINNKIDNLVKIISENGVYSVSIVYRKIINKIYNIIFLKRYNIYSDISSDFLGINFMSIGSLHVGKGCRIEAISKFKHQIFYPELIIGNNVSINDYVHIACVNKISIGDNCLFASKIYISDHNHGIYKGEFVSDVNVKVSERDLDTDKVVYIDENVWIGENVSILPNSYIGKNSIIGANSVVKGYIPENSIAVGVPARVVRTLNN